jgi:hypothetical protein
MRAATEVELHFTAIPNLLRGKLICRKILVAHSLGVQRDGQMFAGWGARGLAGYLIET